MLRTPIDEFIDIAVVVGEENEVLKILHLRAGIMRQASERIVGAQPVKQRKRDCLTILDFDPVSQFIANQREIGCREMLGDFLRFNPDHRCARIPIEHIGEGDFLQRQADLNFDFILFRDQCQLLAKIAAKQGGAGDSCGVGALLLQPAKGTAAIFWLANAGEIEAQFGIGISAITAPLWVRLGSIAAKGNDIFAQRVDSCVITGLQLVEDCVDGGFGRGH